MCTHMVPIFSCILLHRYVHHVASIISKTAETCACVDFVDCVLHVHTCTICYYAVISTCVASKSEIQKTTIVFLGQVDQGFCCGYLYESEVEAACRLMDRC